MKAFWVHAVFVLVSVLAGCGDRDAPETAAEIAVTNSYLACAVRDLCGEQMQILCLVPPGMCPGHFDISPAQVRQLRDCRVLLLFDFQQPVEQRLTRLREHGLKIRRVGAPPDLCIPDTYLATCGQLDRILSDEYPEKAAEFARRLSAIGERLEQLAAELRGAVAEAAVTPAKVLASSHQAGFAKWLGLEPVATFVGSDIETVAGVDHCLRKAAGQDIRFVIANRQEGTALAQALADRLRARAVVFSNFPQATEDVSGFDRLIRDNVQRLVEAGAR